MKFNAGVTAVILTLVTLLGAGYLTFGVLDFEPTAQPTRITLLLDNSGGLMPTSQVTMRGIQVGKVTGIRTSAGGLKVSIELNRDHSIPANSAISIQNLSLVGEQYIDFQPKHIAPPYFNDGTVIPADRVATAVTVSDLLNKANALLSVLNPTYVNNIVGNISQAFADNDAAIDSLAETAGAAARMERENKQVLATLFGNLALLTDHISEQDVGGVLARSGKLLPGSILALAKLTHEVDEYAHAGDGAFAPGAPIPTLVANLRGYLDMLAGPLSTFAAALEPATAPLRGFKVDAGHFVDIWASTFSDAGGVRVQVTVPEGHQ
ncbi:mammalian cell entry protein [Mycobacterium asiaticum]|uniref:Mammalian cell entry protein n=1 Tax=Mycobacterium asiaticum TaxID=1790 RepID=A0A1A3PAJ7_MYCAS|nr:MlaD family protein [Mycobacterium asiaticum]OBK30324.1 mammalian cell entry protein [Mycobacterium asiaticum]